MKKNFEISIAPTFKGLNIEKSIAPTFKSGVELK